MLILAEGVVDDVPRSVLPSVAFTTSILSR